MPDQDLLAELQAENARLVALLESHRIEWRQPPVSLPVALEPSRLSTGEKVSLFRRLFRGRTDVYSEFAEGRIAIMALAEIEQARVRKAMDACLQQRRPSPHVRPELDLGFRVSGQSVEIFEIRPRWRVFWQRRDLKWHSYEPQPEVESVEEFASLVSEDAYACFFG